MAIVFSPSTKSDIKWLRRYYTSVFSGGSKQAKIHYLQTINMLMSHPLSGHPVAVDGPLRELTIPRTPFSFVYYLDGEDIIVVRVLDGRAERPASLNVWQ
jgi:toxin ParE1/3/4